MISVILMGFVTVAAVFFLIETGKASKTAAAEIVMSKAWSSRFARQSRNAWMNMRAGKRCQR